jgi:hypothetical chaperone protein
VDAIYLTGGSSALRPLRQALRAAFPAIPQVEGDLFGGVAAGLAVSRYSRASDCYQLNSYQGLLH